MNFYLQEDPSHFAIGRLSADTGCWNTEHATTK